LHLTWLHFNHSLVFFVEIRPLTIAMKTPPPASKSGQSMRKLRAFLWSVRLFISKKIRFRALTAYRQSFQHPALIEGVRKIDPASDIAAHLSTLFFFAMDAKPRLIVELGTRGGESTRVLLSAASLTNAVTLSLDIEDCSGLDLAHRQCWHFVKGDDIEFGKTGFAKWCAAVNLKPEIDLLFIDTSHLYEHTKQEIEVWSPLLSERGIMIFHDTNMGRGLSGRLGHLIGHGWDNQRGVIRAIEEFLGKHYDENCFFTDVANGFLVAHYPHSNGLTVLKRLSGCI
jgi:predicted O-methyltransferase YrrM